MLYMSIRSMGYPEFKVRFVTKEDWEQEEVFPEVAMTDIIKQHIPENFIGEERENNEFYYSMFDQSIHEFEKSMEEIGCIATDRIQDLNSGDIPITIIE